MSTNSSNIENKIDIPQSTVSSSNKIWRKLEYLCKAVSSLTIVLLFVQIIVTKLGGHFSSGFAMVLAVLLSAAVGYLTNYLAIEMLFKPYERSSTHFLSIITFGFWKQGLIPSKKNEIASEMGRQIESKLLNPTMIADEFCQMASNLIDNESVMNHLETGVRNLLLTHEETIVDFIYPQVESSLVHFVDDMLTAENFEKFFVENIDPWLRQENVRQEMADAIVAFGRQRSEQIVSIIKEEGRRQLYSYLSENPFTSFTAKSISDGVINFIQWNKIEWRIYEKIKEEKTQRLIRDELLKFLNHLRERLEKGEMRPKVESFLNAIKAESKAMLSRYLRESLPKMAKEIIASDTLWIWAKTDFLPRMKPGIESWIRDNGRDLIIDKLNIAQRVKTAVDKQNVREFHGMINNLAAEHLGAIQVLGWILGGIVGLLQLLVR